MHESMGREIFRQNRKMLSKLVSFDNKIVVFCILYSLTSSINGESYEYDIDYVIDDNYYDPGDQIAMAVAPRPNQGEL